MITAVLEAGSDAVRLARVLSSLVPAATEGVVRDVVVLDRAGDATALAVADAACCLIIDAGPEDDPLATAIAQARGDWLLLMGAADALPPEWQVDALAFIDRALVSGTALRRGATLRSGRLPANAIAWLRAVLRGDATARLVAKSAWLAAHARGQGRSAAASPVSGVRRGAA
jgi:hypothetical protein